MGGFTGKLFAWPDLHLGLGYLGGGGVTRDAMREQHLYWAAPRRIFILTRAKKRNDKYTYREREKNHLQKLIKTFHIPRGLKD